MASPRRPDNRVLFCLLLGILLNIHTVNVAANACPTLFLEVKEHTEVGSVITEFESSAAAIHLIPSSATSNGYLRLVNNGSTAYQVVLNKHIDLLQLNPNRVTPVPITDEIVQCDNDSDSRSDIIANQLSFIKTLQYTLRCSIEHQSTTINISSDVRLIIEDVNDNVPYFMCSPYHKTVDELTPVGTTIFTLKGLAADLDIEGGIAGYDLDSSSEGMFALVGAASEGFIIVEEQLDYDNGPKEYKLNITTTDIGDPSRSNWTYLYIHVADNDDQNPVFGQHIYHLSLPEEDENIVNQRIKTSPAINAQDLDTGINAQIAYEMIAGYSFDDVIYFEMHRETGELIPIRKLNRKQNPQFIITVKAYQVDNAALRFSYATLVVNVADTNTHAPVMTDVFYNVSLYENPPRGFQVAQVRAIDGDAGANSEFAYYLIDPGGALAINPETGSVYIEDSSVLDRETQHVFTAVVYAQETNTTEERRSDNATINIVLYDVNDNSPVYNPSYYEFLVNKSEVSGSVIGRVSATDGDTAENAAIFYKLLYGEGGSLEFFSIYEGSGEITLAKSLSSSPVDSYLITVEARDQPLDSSQSRSAVAHVVIRVLSVNENPPVFLGAPYSVSISESARVGDSVLQLTAQDADGTTPADFKIVTGNSDGQFTVDLSSGLLAVATPLDRETTSLYNLSVSVTDGKLEATALVTVTVTDANDNYPKFLSPSYTFNITEEAGRDSYIGSVKATDADEGLNAKIQYQIVEDEVSQFVVVDPDTGDLATIVTLDREEVPHVRFHVAATDEGTPPMTSSVLVNMYIADVNDNPPLFPSGNMYRVTVPERSTPGFILQIEASDADVGENAETRYALVSGDADLFSVDPNTGHVSTLAELNPEQTTHGLQYMLEIMAYNTQPYHGDSPASNDTANVMVVVQDVNDNSPVFTQSVYDVLVPEGTPVGDIVSRVVANDADSSSSFKKIHYWLGPGADAEMFMVDEFLGDIRLMKPLDRDSPSNQHSLSLMVYASDMLPTKPSMAIINSSAIVNVTVGDVNDNIPRFSKVMYTVSLYENVSIGDVVDVDVRATDIDSGRNGDFTYDILTLGSPVQIGGKSGQVKIARNLDYDDGQREYQIMLVAIDAGQPFQTGSATLKMTVLNVNDNQPQFEFNEYRFDINENQPAQTLLGMVTATDGDGDLLTYRFTGASTGFTVSENGALRTSSPLDYETQIVHSLVVEVEETTTADGQEITNPQTVMVSVIVTVFDQNDNEPKFAQNSYRATFEEDVEYSEMIEVKATDDDTGSNGVIRYNIVAGNGGDIFYINSTSGQLWVNGTGVDASINPKYQLTVEAADNGDPALRSFASVEIDVIDTNNHVPVFSSPVYRAEVEENQPEVFVIQITGTDGDSSDQLTYAILQTDAFFTINPDNGMIHTTAPLNREARDLITLNISISDGLHVTYAEIMVEIIDQNDNSPKFSREQFEKALSLGSVAGRSVITLRAEDEDVGENGLVTHWLTGTGGKFQIDPISGVVTTTSPFTDQDKTSYMMTVYAKDNGATSFMTSATLIVHINNTNFHAPQFSQFSYDVTLSEATATDSTLLTLDVTDKDEADAGLFDLEITSGNTDNVFQINSNHELILSSSLDYETTRYYTLTVTARDRASDSKSSSVRIYVTVTDVNDRPPEFMPMPDVIHVAGPVIRGQLIFQFSATDSDGDGIGNDAVSYRLLSSTEGFDLNTFIGEMRAKDLPVGEYSVRVRASDQGIPTLTTEANLLVKVQNRTNMDLYPLFEQQVYRVTFNESKTNVPIHLVNMNAKIGSGASDSGVFYNLTGGPRKEAFSINANTGAISVVQSLDREEYKSHTLVVSAYNTVNPAFSTHTSVYVTVEDYNDFSPYFPFPEYDITISEATPAGSIIAQLEAIDEDISPQINYKILDIGASTGNFRLLSSGNKVSIILDKQIDREMMPSSSEDIYTLWINVDDGPTMNNGAPAYLRIKISDVNDNAPSFSNSNYTAAVPENTSPCVEIIQMRATDLDLVDEGELVYSILDVPNNYPFEINNSTGMVRKTCGIDTPLNREETDHYQLIINVTDSVGQTAQTRVDIILEDVNDNPPTFIGTPYTLDVQEGSAVLDVRAYVTARDMDLGENSQIVFSLHERHTSDFTIFTTTIDGTDYLGTIAVVSALDREQPGLTIVGGSALYPVTVMARDQGSPSLTSTATVTLVISDINDSPPVFERAVYDLSLSEGTPVDTPVIVVRATDPDLPENTNLTYSITQNDEFAIDALSGTVRVVGVLDVNQQSEFNLALTASDGVFSTSSTLKVVLVDTNDKDPVFTQPVYYFTVAENDKSGQTGDIVGQVVAVDSDRGDNGVVQYNITSRGGRDLFLIQQSDGTISTIGTLDRETEDKYTIIVTATDKGSPPRMSTCEVEIEVMDVNDNSPVFIDAPYTGSVQEHAPQGSVVFVHPLVKATDADMGANGDVAFSLQGQAADLFIIDPRTGEVTVSAAGAGSFDRENEGTLELQVRAVDGGTPFLTSVTTVVITLIDINDQPPVFEKSMYEFSTNEQTSPGSAVGAVRATDEDAAPNNRISYSLVSGGLGQFYLDKFSGEIFILGGLDREVIASYRLNISASDSGVTPGPLETFVEARVDITDFNDNPPMFDKDGATTFYVAENQQAPFLVTQIVATDPDAGQNGEIRYSLGEERTGNFSIDSVSGRLSTRIVLDRETEDLYQVTVIATDQGSPSLTSSVSILIHVLDTNDHVPQFTLPEYRINILEKSPMDSVILYASATDGDTEENGEITYSLSGAAGVDQYFSIDGTTGLVKIVQPVDKRTLGERGLLTGSNSSTVVMTLRASDGGEPALVGTATLHVKIDEINDDAPQFNNASYEAEIKEGMPADSAVVAVLASVKDADTMISYSVVGSDDFKMQDPFTGLVVTKIELDREKQTSFSFTVRAMDNRIPQRTAYAAVQVTISDVNDNPPVFPVRVYTTSVPEGDYITPHTLTHVSATDADQGNNGAVTYSLSGARPEAPRFEIDLGSGVLIVTGDIDRESTSEYNVTVIATDGGDPALSSSVVVNVIVEDVNDNPPTFLSQSYRGNISRAAQPGDVVMEVFAMDPDQGVNAVFVYEILNGAQSPFYIQTKGRKGILRLSSSLSESYLESYDLVVAAVDYGDRSLNSTVSVTIRVTEPGEGFPSFDQSLFAVSVPDDAAINATVLVLEAGQGTFQYSILDGNTDDTFDIDPSSGTLILTRGLLFGSQTAYLLTVQATVPNNPNLKDAAQVMVTVVQSTDYPVFDQSEYSASYPENIQNALPRLVIDLDTADERIGRKLFYYIIDNQYEGMFSIDNSTGQIWCTSVLDRELTAEFTFRVGCDRLTTGSRRKRQAAPPNEAVVVISVGDKNDNPPIFFSNPLVYGVPSTAELNHLVATIQAEDKDSGNNSLSHYVITGGADKDLFYIDMRTGQLYLATSMSDTEKTNFELSVSATDNLGQGQTANVNVKIFILTDNERVVLVANIPPPQFKGRENILLRNLSDILGWPLQIEKILPHTEERDGKPYVDVSITDMYFYAVSPDGLVPRADVMKKIEEKAREIEALFKMFDVEDVKPVVMTTEIQLGFALSAAEAALLVIGVLVVFGAIIGAIFICVSWKKKEDERKQNELNAMFSTRKPYGMANPVFEGVDCYSEPIDVNNFTMYDSCKPMETQRVSIFLTDDRDAESSNSNQHANTSTFSHDTGNTILVVDGEEERDRPNERDNWASPYTADAAMPSRGTSQSSGYTSSDVEVISPSSSAGQGNRRQTSRAPVVPSHPPSVVHRVPSYSGPSSAPRQSVPKSPKSEREAIEALQRLIHDRTADTASMFRADGDAYTTNLPGSDAADVGHRPTYQTRLPERQPLNEPLPPPPIRCSKRRLFPPQTHPPPLSRGLLKDEPHQPHQPDLPGAVPPSHAPITTPRASSSNQPESPSNPSPSSHDVDETLVKSPSGDLPVTLTDEDDPTYARVLPVVMRLHHEDADLGDRLSRADRESHYDMPKISYATVTRGKKQDIKKPEVDDARYRTVININTQDNFIRSSVRKVNGRRGSKVSPLSSSAENSPTNSAKGRNGKRSRPKDGKVSPSASAGSSDDRTSHVAHTGHAGSHVSIGYTEL